MHCPNCLPAGYMSSSQHKRLIQGTGALLNAVLAEYPMVGWSGAGFCRVASVGGMWGPHPMMMRAHLECAIKAGSKDGVAADDVAHGSDEQLQPWVLCSFFNMQ